MSERIKTAVKALTELPGYEDIFAHFKKEYGNDVLNCPEMDMTDRRRKYEWLAEFKQEIENVNSEN